MADRIPAFIMIVKAGFPPLDERGFVFGSLDRHAPGISKIPGITVTPNYNADAIDDMYVSTVVAQAFSCGQWRGDFTKHDLEWKSIVHEDGSKGAMVFLYPKAGEDTMK